MLVFNWNFNMNILQTKIIHCIVFIGTLFVIGFALFAFPKSADACSVVLNSNTRFRTAYNNGGPQPDSFFTDENNPPFVYVDVDTDDCTNTDTLALSILYLSAVPLYADPISHILGEIFSTEDANYFLISIGSINQVIDSDGRFTVALRVGSDGCFEANEDYDCLMLGMIQNSNTGDILAMIGNALANMTLEDASFFLSTFYPQLTSIPGSSGSDCLGTGTEVGFYYQQTSPLCPGKFNGYNLFYSSFPLDTLLLNYYNSYPNLNHIFSVPGTTDTEYRIGLPGLLFNCPGLISCGDTDWQIPSGALIPYGETHPDDQGAVVVSPLPNNYQQDYIPLAPLPFEGLSGGPTPSLGEYLASIFRMAIVVTAILAVLMIVYHGVAYATTAAVGGKTDHKVGVYNAILGLVLALGSWLLLNTISPRLASQLSINIPNVNLDGYEYVEDGVAVIPSGCPKPGILPAVCPTCQTIAEGVPIKNSINTPEHNKILAGMNTKLVQLNSTLSQNSISWQITEAFKNTVNHCSVCHYRGTCVDANFTGGSQPTVENIKAFIQSASSAGLRAVYETNNQSTYQTLLDADIPKSKGDSGNLLWLQNITAPHFSVYNK